MKTRIFLFQLFFFTISTTFSQSYQPLDTADFAKRNEFIKKLAIKKESVTKKVKAKYQGETATEMNKFYDDYYKDFEKDINDKNYTFNSSFDNRLNAIVKHLKTSNTTIPDNLYILIAKDNAPNAYCLSDGTFVVNMGLFNWIDNEQQMAGILSHEIAHNLLEHAEKMIVQHVLFNKSDKNTYANINKLTSNKSKVAFNIVKNRVYKNSEAKRKQETEADSLGYILYKNADYPPSEYINALKNIQNFDSISPRKLNIETYKLLYNLPEQPYREEWMKEEDFSLYNYNLYKDKLNKDSLSSHPETTQRIDFLQQYFSELVVEKPIIAPDNDFEELQLTARKEIVPNLYYSEDFGIGIYVAMQFLQDREDESYYKMWLGKLFQKIYEARKNYNLNRYLDTVNPKKQSESYRQFLNFMWNLNVDEIQKIADFYQKNQ